MTTLECLKAARELIATPEKWTQGETARDALGRAVPSGPDYPPAVCYCSLGAINRVATSVDEYTACVDVLGGAQQVIRMNDEHGTTHADVLAEFDRAIVLAEKAG